MNESTLKAIALHLSAPYKSKVEAKDVERFLTNGLCTAKLVSPVKFAILTSIFQEFSPEMLAKYSSSLGLPVTRLKTLYLELKDTGYGSVETWELFFNANHNQQSDK